MEYISAEEFLKQPKEVQKVFLEWWKPTLGDIYRDLTPRADDKFNLIHVCEDEFDRKDTELTKENFGGIIPLLTEGQLRKFIEDKTSSVIDMEHHWKEDGYSVYLYQCEDFINSFNGLGDNLLQVYWKVAIEIAKEKVKA
jgi:hypothetical protein